VDRFINGRDASAGSYALVCPGVALAVMIHFWLNRGLVDAGLIDSFRLRTGRFQRWLWRSSS